MEVIGSLSAPNPSSVLYSLCDAGAGLLCTPGPHFSFVSWLQLALPTGDARRRLKGKRKKGFAPPTPHQLLAALPLSSSPLPVL